MLLGGERCRLLGSRGADGALAGTAAPVGSMGMNDVVALFVIKTHMREDAFLSFILRLASRHKNLQQIQELS